MRRMKTQAAIELAGSNKALAELLGVTPGAVSQWVDEIPEGRYWQLRVIKPEWFSPADSAPKATENGQAA